MQNTELDHQREDPRKAHSNDDGRGPTHTIVRCFHAILMLAAVAYALPAQSQPAAVVYDAPGSISTMIGGISPLGTITGSYTDVNTNSHGFLLTREGQFTTFDAPGALSALPEGVSVNSAGVTAGTYGKYAGEIPGIGPVYFFANFLRLADGALFDIEPPSTIESGPPAINDQGTVVGTYLGEDFTQHFFLRAANGTFTEFDPEPGARANQMCGINPGGTVTGSYSDTNGQTHSFLCTAQGKVTSFDDPEAVNGTSATSISPSGAITGNYLDANYNAHGFLRNQHGQITNFDPQGSTSTYPIGIAPNGVIAGNYNDANYQSHGFVRTKNGKITSFDPEGSMSTYITGINPGGVISGYYFDASFNSHGFVAQTEAD